MRSPGLLLSLALFGCDPDLSQLADATPPPDAKLPPDAPPPIDAPPPDAACRDRVLDLAALEFPSGHHFDGDGCTLGCHNGTNGPAFHFGGTVYVNYGGQAPRPGVTVHVLDAEGRMYEAVTRQNGNFWLRTNAGPMTFPVKTWVSECPQVKEMIIPTPAPGNCNDTSTACHTIDPPFRIRLPLNP